MSAALQSLDALEAFVSTPIADVNYQSVWRQLFRTCEDPRSQALSIHPRQSIIDAYSFRQIFDVLSPSLSLSLLKESTPIFEDLLFSNSLNDLENKNKQNDLNDLFIIYEKAKKLVRELCNDDPFLHSTIFQAFRDLISPYNRTFSILLSKYSHKVLICTLEVLDYPVIFSKISTFYELIDDKSIFDSKTKDFLIERFFKNRSRNDRKSISEKEAVFFDGLSRACGNMAKN